MIKPVKTYRQVWSAARRNIGTVGPAVEDPDENDHFKWRAVIGP
jgi:hypothetical protein